MKKWLVFIFILIGVISSFSVLADCRVCTGIKAINNLDCGQSTSQCSGNRTGLRDSYGNCIMQLNSPTKCCADDPFDPAVCVKGLCGAQCSNDIQCADGNSHTQDTCSAGCECIHTPIPFCGDGIINGNDQCELPSTSNNNFCPIANNESCLGTKWDGQSHLGRCLLNCQCFTPVLDDFNCVKGKCGANCSIAADCNDNNPSTTDTCNGCVCRHTAPQPVCGDGVINGVEQCETPNTHYNPHCSNGVNETCQGTQFAGRPQFGRCNETCGCFTSPFGAFACVKGRCGANCSTAADCNDNNAATTDTCDGCVCKHTIIGPSCGDGVVNGNEQCELPNSLNNQLCPERLTVCNGNLTGTRSSAFGDCDSSCMCLALTPVFSCIRDSCHAQCSTEEDCDDSNPQTIDTCTETCGCTHNNITPEFGLSTAIVALIGSIAAFALLRKH